MDELIRRIGQKKAELAQQQSNAPLAWMDVRNLHRMVMLRSAPDIAGRYADQGRFVLTDAGRHSFPSPAELPSLMGEFAKWLGAAPATPDTAFTTHRRLVGVRPFNDGNARAARIRSTVCFTSD